MPNVNCEICGKSFYVKPYLLLKGKGRFCGKKCYGKSKTKQVLLICATCGKEFTQIPCNVKNKGNYCSPKCSAESRIGNGHPFWKGGWDHYRGANWTKQKRLAYKRDEGKCQNCGKTERENRRKCAVHHIKPYREFNGDFVSANDLRNLITLCDSCHVKAEHGKITLQPKLL